MAQILNHSIAAGLASAGAPAVAFEDRSVPASLLRSPNPGCKCEGGCLDRQVCACVDRSQGRNYDPTDNTLLQLRIPRPRFDRPVYECNDRCSCRKEAC
uniref:Pre-SET domain-containing protein n=1 Tax=Mesocestoides corti TaxID=53468 RepID=A0A5K3FUC2_MESCO